MRTAPARPGVSLLEVVVVLLIAAATCLLLLPALNRSRENARAKYCRNNLRRLDQAMQQYLEVGTRQVSSHTTTPRSRLNRKQPRANWPVKLIGYLDSELDRSRIGQRPDRCP